MDTTEMIDPVTGETIDQQQLAEHLLRQAKEQGVDLLGPDGLLNGLAKQVLETALEAKMVEQSINTAWPLATVQTCIIHLICDTSRFASRHHCEEMGKDHRPVYTAPTEAAAAERFAEFDAKWGGQYPAITKLWQYA